MTAVLLAAAGTARAGTLTVDAPDGCVDLATLNQEVADLVGRPLADSPDTDFHLTIAPGHAGRWHLRLEATHGAGPAQVRELDAAKCAELADAAAVAIAVSVRALTEAEAPQTTPARRPDITPDPAATAPPMIQLAPDPPRPRWRPGLTVSVAGDSGDLPGTGPGVMGGAMLGRRLVRLALTVGWFPARDAAAVSGGGGRFQLVFAAGDGCFAPAWGKWTLLACGGVEVGAYGATGQDVARPSTRTTLWRAGRARLGAAFSLTDSIAFAVNGTAVIPLARPTFVLDGMLDVFRPAAAGARIDAGLEVVF
ncbi:MAG TPA: hypothetical protein VHO67_08405 [Polyangia bacterium]|nr:hypothetical protein [Polyangia bacterium]